MKYIEEFRNGSIASELSARITAETENGRVYRLMEFCGGHTHAIARFGIVDLLPSSIRMIHGPGCPVCVLPTERIDMALDIARNHKVTLCSYGDLMRVPGSKGRSLTKEKAAGADIRMIYSVLEALDIAKTETTREVVFFAIGFETTSPATAIAIQRAQEAKIPNFSVFCNHVITPSAIQNILESPDTQNLEPVKIDGLLGPSHVSVVIGTEPYKFLAKKFAKPVVIAGFEPLDVMQAILMLLRQVNSRRADVENQYVRAVLPTGNHIAKAAVDNVFELRKSFKWRGLGNIPYSGLKLKANYSQFDAEERFTIGHHNEQDNPACLCGEVLRGNKTPRECQLFGKVCTPETPVGPCMVSAEGACSAHWTYNRFRDHGNKKCR